MATVAAEPKRASGGGPRGSNGQVVAGGPRGSSGQVVAEAGTRRSSAEPRRNSAEPSLPKRASGAEPRRSSGDSSLAKRQSQAAALLALYQEDASRDPEESLHRSQYLLIKVENLLPETIQTLPAKPIGGMLETIREVAMGRRLVPLRALHQAKLSSGPASVGLLRCINTIVARGAQFRLQEQLQRLVLMYTGSANAKDFAECLPPSMRSPRSAVHVQDRLKHWETLRREVDLVHYMHDLEVPKEIRISGEDEHGAGAPPPRLAMIQELRKNSDPKVVLAARTPPQIHSSRPPPSRPQSSSGKRRPSTSGCLSELARKSRMLEGDLEMLDVKPTEVADLMRRDKATQALARLLAPSGDDTEDSQGDSTRLPSPVGAASPLTSRNGSKVKAPPLTGITTGFMVAQSPECPKADRFLVQYPRQPSKPSAAPGLKAATSCPNLLAAAPKPDIPSRPSTGPSEKRRKRPVAAPEEQQQKQSSNLVSDKELQDVQAKMRRAANEGLPPDNQQSTRWGKGFSLVTMTPANTERRPSTTRHSSRRPSTTPAVLSGGATALFGRGGSQGASNKAGSKKSSMSAEERKPSSIAPPEGDQSTEPSAEKTRPATAETIGRSGTVKVFANAARRGRSSRQSFSGSRPSHLGSRASLTGLSAGRAAQISLEGQMEDLLSKVLQQRGLEKKPAVRELDLELEDQRAAEAAAARARRLQRGSVSESMPEAASPRTRKSEVAKLSQARAKRAPSAAAKASVQGKALDELLTDAGLKSGADTRRNSILEEASVIPGKPKGVVEPPAKRLPTVECSWTAEVGYLRGCMQGKVYPRLIKMFVDDNSPKLDMDSQFLVDGELDAVLRALQAPHASKDNAIRDQPISELTLANNPSLTDFCVARFLTTAVGSVNARACIGPLKRLSIAFCTGIGEVAMGTLADLLGRGTDLVHLEELDFSSVPVPSASWPTLTAGLGCARFLRRLLLAQTGCGRSTQASCVAIAELIENHALARIEVLDLGGNHFLDEGCRALGAALRHSPDTLRELDLSHNAGLNPIMFVKDAESNPITHVLEALGETTLEKVALVNCQLAYKEDCVLEASVTCSDITHLDVSDNPHGETGLRCLVRLLAGEAPKLEQLLLESVRLHPACGQMTYEFTNPTCAYRLHMENVQHRSILRLLLKRCEAVTGNSRCTCFKQGRFEDKPLGDEGASNGMLQLCSKRKDRGGDDWQVPDKGILEFFFQMPSIYDDEEKIDLVYNKFQRRNKICTNFKGFAKLLQVYRGLVDKQSQTLFLEAMSKDLCLKFCQVKTLGMVTQDLLTFVLRSLLPETTQLPLRSTLFDLVVCCSKSWPEALPLKLAAECRNLVFFNFVHPDGHYELSLESPADRATAQRCIVAAAWIKAYCQTKGILDISQYGDLECMWHVVHNSTEVRGASTEWQLQERGKLRFDFVLPRLRFGKRGPVEESSTIQALGEAIRESPCKYRDRLHALHLVAHQLVLTPDQLKAAVEWFPAHCPNHGKKVYEDMGQAPLQPRAEAYVALYNRTLEHSEVVSPRVLYNHGLLHEEEVCEIRKRLGMMHTFDVVNLHDARSNLGTRHGPIDLVTWDGFTVLKAMVGISKEETSVNFQDGFWSEQAAFYERGFAFILPASWHPDPPRVGQFTTTFTSKDDEVNYAHRKEVARRLFGWTFPEALDDA